MGASAWWFIGGILAGWLSCMGVSLLVYRRIARIRAERGVEAMIDEAKRQQ